MLAVKRNIKKERELFVAANAPCMEGNNDLADYVMRNSRRLTDIIDSVLKFEQSSIELSDELIPRMVRVRDLAEGSCE